MLKKYWFFFFLILSLRASLEAQHLRITSITGSHFPAAGDTTFEFLSSANINILIANDDSVNDFLDTLTVPVYSDSAGLPHDTIYHSDTAVAIPHLTTSTFFVDSFQFKSSSFNDGDNIIVIWPQARHAVPYDSVIYHIYYISVALGIPEKEKPTLTIGPNPSHGILYIDGYDKMKIKQVRIVDIAGRVVYRNTSLDHFLPTDNWPTGIYFLEIEQGNTVQRIKVIKEEN